MNRRHFLRTTATAAGLVALQGPGALAQAPAPASATRLTILHTNDVHSHLDPMTTGPFKGMGGAEARAAFVQKWREKVAREGGMLLVVDAGDMLQGTPYFNEFRGEAEMKAMNAIGYDAACIGNHDFDAGIERLAELRSIMKFQLLNANYEFAGTPLDGFRRPIVLKELAGVTVGIFGLGIRLQGLVPAELFGATRYTDPASAAKQEAARLRNEAGCDFIIALSHLSIGGAGGEPGDRDIIREVPEIDVVVGGHNHFLLAEPEVHYRGRGTSMGYVAQAGWGGTHIGVLQFDIYGRDQKELAGVAAAPLVQQA